jgi:hypothetical protein
MYHAIHAFGLAELLKSGVVENVDDEHFWNLIDNTYIDDVGDCDTQMWDSNAYSYRLTKRCLPDAIPCMTTTSTSLRHTHLRYRPTR